MKMETNKIYQGDAIAIMKSWPDKSVDFIFTDPPYGHNNNNGDLIHRIEKAIPARRKTTDFGNEEYQPRPILNDGAEANALVRAFFSEASRLLKPGSCCCCCCGGPDPQFARWSLWLDEVLDFKQMVVWDKGPMGMGWHYRRSYETVLVAQKPGAACRWYDESNAVENVVRPGVAPKIIPSEDQHPTEKPAELASLFIGYHSRPGDVVLDPFCGSGSTLDAANRMGRKWVGIELDPKFHAMAAERMNRAVVLPPAQAFEQGRLF